MCLPTVTLRENALLYVAKLITGSIRRLVRAAPRRRHRALLVYGYFIDRWRST
jgi:hypothetical protein